jgi:predicted nucleic acid-binding protein
MPDIEELRDPHPGDFYQPSNSGTINVPDTDIFIGKRALEAFFYEESSDLDDIDKIRQAYSCQLLEGATETEFPFRTIHTTRETLNVAITSLGHGRGEQESADDCLNTVMDSDLFRIHHCSEEVYEAAKDEFLQYESREISIQEAVLALCAKDLEVHHIMTWDSDFTRYYEDGMTLYPRNFWE